MGDIEARKFCCGYCMRGKCCEYGANACLIGTYILCCDCGAKKRMTLERVMTNDDNKPLRLKNMNKNSEDVKKKEKQKNDDKLTFLSFIASRWSNKGMIDDDIMDGSELSAYSSTSDFLYQQKSGYGGHIGLNKQSSKSPKTPINTKSQKYSISESADESYIL